MRLVATVSARATRNALMDPLPAAQSWFPSLEALEAYSLRRREEQSGWHFEPAAAPVVDPVSVIVLIEEYT